MEKVPDAFKHGVAAEAIDQALRNAIRVIEQEYDGEIRQLIIGADGTGRLLELVVRHDEKGARVIHADVLRRKFYKYL